MKKKIIIDTDIGTNADDAIAISLAVNSPEIDLLGITVVYGDTLSRAQTAYKLLKLLNHEEIPIFLGSKQTLLNNRSIDLEKRPIFERWCDKSFVPQKCHAVNFIIDTIMQNPHEVTLVTIAPLTNIALALTIEPRIADNIKEIVMMGGVTHLGSIGNLLPKNEHNISSDPEAAYRVFNSNIPITMFGLDSTYQIKLMPSHIDKILENNCSDTFLLVDMIYTWMEHVNRDFSYMCDPLPILHLVDNSIFTFEKMNIDICYTNDSVSGTTIGKIDANGCVNVCLEADEYKIIDCIMQILLNKKREKTSSI